MSGQNTPPKKQIACFIKLRILKMYFFRWLQESVCNLEHLNPVPKRYFKAHTRICLIDTKNSSHQDDPETWFQVRSSVIANRKVEAFFGAHLSLLQDNLVRYPYQNARRGDLSLWNSNRLPVDDSPRCLSPARIIFAGLLPQRSQWWDTLPRMKSLWIC